VHFVCSTNRGRPFTDELAGVHIESYCSRCEFGSSVAAMTEISTVMTTINGGGGGGRKGGGGGGGR
jgi:hypothetical protein